MLIYELIFLEKNLYIIEGIIKEEKVMVGN